ncbi:sugar nucleotide-binding protein [Tsuneonella sp. CC-YZS046]|uniref:SDR family oxidoreductase n=1 Tax=Tsuneonella sp. CC-YZS046 TaxID=3042152 RepID=UPI002D76D7D6|nr:sugar nucleotide-binding protein [Tsuneonella sp. CC-YZS046]WRO65583.1 sugar nucleotide-binding protein [Tsuneonella sp. CC-YZS046]
MIRLLVTGGKGMLGRALAEHVASLSGATFSAPGRDELDVRDADALLNAASQARGGWIAHCAATVDVEGCAREPDAAREIIVEGTRNVVRAARAAGARLFYPQSFLVYDGASNPIPEDETPQPLSLYGKLKLEAEQVIRAEMDDALIVRMAGFFGGEEIDKNFVGRIIPAMAAAMERGETRFDIGDRVWQPTWTRDLAENSIQMMLADKRGIYQMACHGQASFAELAQEIVAALGWEDRLRIERVEAASVSGNELGKRPDIAVLSCTRLREDRLDLQRDWRATIHAYLRHPYFDRYRLKGA